jgi:hypothetical protein
MEMAAWKRVVGLDGCVRNRLWVAWCTGEGERERDSWATLRVACCIPAYCYMSMCVCIYVYVYVYVHVFVYICVGCWWVGGEKREGERERGSERQKATHTYTTQMRRQKSLARTQTDARTRGALIPPPPPPPPSTPIQRKRSYFPPSILHRNGARL